MIIKFKNKFRFLLLFLLFFNILLLNPNIYFIKNNFLTFNSKIPSISISYSNSPLQGKKIGIVKTHGEGDPFFHYTITLNDVQDMGATVDNITTEVNSSLLNLYDIIIIDVQGTNWTSNELTDLYTWVQNNGSLYVWGDYGSARVNVSAKFDVFYNNTATFKGTLILNDNPPILQGVNTLYADGPLASIDLNVSRNDLMVIALSRDNSPIIVALQENEGRVLWLCDVVGTIENTYISSYDNHLFANNSWLWLGGVLGNEYSPKPSDWWILLLSEKLIEIPFSLTFIILISSLAIVFTIITIFYIKKRR
ncbi:MAG: hypothetical protein ACTSRG_09065 [Candidatus Helarchaeota archaeon]